MDWSVCTLLIVNALFAVGFGLPLARRLARIAGRPERILRSWALVLAVYLLECFAFSASMATNIIPIALAGVWGVLLGRWLRGRTGRRDALKTALCVSLYSSLPAVSFAGVLVVLIVAGWPILTPDAALRFGVPPFVPWPFNTLLRFFAAVIGSAVVCKTAITIAIVILLLRRRGAPDDGAGGPSPPEAALR